MRFSLRTLIIVMLLGGPVLAGAWWACERVAPRVAVPLFVSLCVGFVLALVVDLCTRLRGIREE